MAQQDSSITTRAENYSAWYNDVIAQGDLLDDAPVRGCKVLKPHGFGIWENIQKFFDQRFKDTGHVNAYFPLFIPMSFLSKEAAHVEGFAMECALVTHHRLRTTKDEAGNVAVEPDPASQLEEPLVVRPTSETIIWHMYGRWIDSWRDLPILINQWANVVRWEMRTRPFLRTAEFLWQEGHTAHATEAEAVEETLKMLDIYAEVAETKLAVPVVKGRKSARERFAGAVETYTIEAMMQNGWALQAGTSHFLGQNFAKAFDVTFQTKEETRDYVWATSWGVSTRLVGAVIMTHSDDDGLVLPPEVAPIQVVLLPAGPPKVWGQVMPKIDEIAAGLKAAGIRVKVDDRDNVRSGAKFFEWERKGVPLRLEIGPRDMEQGQAFAKRRTGGDKFGIAFDGIVEAVQAELTTIQCELFERARAQREACTYRVDSRAEFVEKIETQPGFYLIPWGGDDADEEAVRDETRATLRCFPMEQEPCDGLTCPLTGKPAQEWAIFARAY
ncbi:MAG: proline--tRNA ligase [Alphaproteobacteria bacterium]|nr:proline--tRNA ligase [Alphaproteobacteria bacterium]